jgi:hypothetical protein
MSTHVHPREHTMGPLFDWAVDHSRLERQMDKIRDYMLAAGWRSLAEIEQATGYPQASISAQLRHLKKVRFGGFGLDKRRRHQEGGTWEYRLIPRTGDANDDSGI